MDFALLQRCERTYGWTRKYANRVWKAYMQFLELKAVHEDWGDDNALLQQQQQLLPQVLVVPSIAIEKLWQQHVLHIMPYINTCMGLFGNVIAYHPDWELVVDMESRRKQIENTLLSLVARYARGGFDKEIWDFGLEMNDLDQRQAHGRHPPGNPVHHPPTGIPFQFSSTTHNPGTGQHQHSMSTASRSAGIAGGGTSSAADDEITIALCCECGTLIYFAIHPLSPLHRAFEMYASTGGCGCGGGRPGRSIPLNNMLFVYKGRLVHHQETAFTLGMADQDKIFVLTVA